MKQVSNIFALTITGIAVKAYMLVAIVWSQSEALYNNLQSYISGLFSSTNTAIAKASA